MMDGNSRQLVLDRNPKQLEAYIKDHYGVCSRGGACPCLKGQWMGTSCPNWTPLPAKNWQELVDIFKARR